MTAAYWVKRQTVELGSRGYWITQKLSVTDRMQPSDAPRNELRRAREAIASMRESQSAPDFDDHWKNFLHRLERVWSKTMAHYRRSPKWGNWAARFDRDRRQDQLLSYLCNARGADEHTTAEVTGREPGGIGIGLADGAGVQPDGSVFIEHLALRSGPGGLEIQSAQPVKIVFHPERVRLEQVINRGRVYSVPENHLGQPINAIDLAGIGDLALVYYESMLNEAEAFFCR